MLTVPAGFASWGFMVAAIVAFAVTVALLIVGAYNFRKPGVIAGALWGAGLVLVGALLASLFDRAGDPIHERQVIDARAAELTVRALAPGSALACLDAVANFDVEMACEKALFASPEAVAAALDYVDARISLLMASTALAQRDPSYRPPLDRMRHSIEADRFGLSAQVLMTRGCKSATCPELKLLRNTGTILANMKARTFDNQVSAHASNWAPNGAAMATAALPPATMTMPQLPAAPSTGTTGAATGVPVPSKFDFPSAASIPPISIMSAEPAAPPQAAEAAAEHAPPPTPPKRPPTPPRRHSSREPAPAAPLSVLPQSAPQPSATR